MVTSICLLTCALTLGQFTDRGDWQLTPRLAPGLELVYAGTYTEESLIPNVQFQRHYRLETTLFVLDVDKSAWDVAVMTSLGLQNSRQPVVQADHKDAPHNVRLELARVDARGRLHGTDKKTLTLSVLGPSTLEFGFLVEVPATRVTRDQVWEVAEDGRPPRSWQAVGSEVCNGVTCVKLVGHQQSEDWDRPRADQTAWRRRDIVWLSPQLNVAHRVERVVERRDPARQGPTHRATVRYDLESRLRYPGKLFEDRRREVLAVQKFQAESAGLLKQPAQYRPQLDHMLRRVAYHLDNQPGTPYRKALVHLKQGLESARRGEAPAVTAPEEPKALPRPVELGEHVPDFVVTSLTDKHTVRYQRCLGKPTLVIFYDPTSRIGREVLLYAKELCGRQNGKLNVLALAVTNDTEPARKQHADLRLPFPVLDGHGLRVTFGVEATPRLVLLDADGVLRSAHTGWGYHVPHEIAEELRRCPPK